MQATESECYSYHRDLSKDFKSSKHIFKEILVWGRKNRDRESRHVVTTVPETRERLEVKCWQYLNENKNSNMEQGS